MTSPEKQYTDLFTQCRGMIDSHSTAIMNARRDDAFNTFKEKGLPTRKCEEYKYTDMAAWFEPDLGLNINRLDIPVNPYDAFKCDVPNLSTQLYFVINDMFYHKAMPKPALPEGVIVSSLRDVAERMPQIVDGYYDRLAHGSGDSIAALNTMLAQDGLVIYIPDNVRMDRTIQVVNILRSDVGMMVNRRVLIIAGRNAEADILFCDHSADNQDFLTTQVVEIYCKENAHLQVYGLEETHLKNTLVSNTYIEQQRDSHFSHTLMTLHNGRTRQTTRLMFKGEGAECNLYGGVIADKEQHVDNNTVIDHAVAHCDSHETYKYVLDGKAVGAFAGKVLVRHGAQKTTSEETNQNLIATKTARMFTQPMLEIYADDVKCSHGSTIGQLNDKALFYMQQRGISLSEARLLLQTAFITEVVDKIPLEPLRNRLHYLIEKRFRGELSKCEGCKLCK